MVLIALHVSTILATAALVLGYAEDGLWAARPPTLLLGLLRSLGRRRGWDWIAPLWLISLHGAAAIGLLLNLEAGWMLLAAVAALSAWDLDAVLRRLGGAQEGDALRDLERRHLGRLLLVNAVGLTLAGMALEFSVRLSLAAAILLGLLALAGLSQMIAFLSLPPNDHPIVDHEQRAG